MSKILENIFYSKMGQSLLSAVGVKPPLDLKRFEPTKQWVSSPVALAETPSPALESVLNAAQIPWQVLGDDETSADAMLFDATGLTRISDLTALKTFFSQASKRLTKSGRIVLIGLNPNKMETIETASVMESLNGFTRSLGKELGRKGVTANVIYCDNKVDSALTTTLNFFLSNRATYISGQPIYLADQSGLSQDWEKPLSGKIALVTGAAQGIGAAIAQTLYRDGATIIGLDIPPAKEALAATLAQMNGIAVATDITSEQAVTDIEQALNGKKLDIIVHNAGVTRDKTLARMPEHFWDMAININLQAPIDVTDGLDAKQLLADDARVICISSISGIAGNVGQTNYSASKSGVVGYVRKQAQKWQETGKTINAIAPGFIETQMTDQIPFMTREVGRRMNSLSQGGQPQDVAEGVALFAQPGANSLNGQILRVCGQSLIGA
jgi:3-oxoacyl-[acyl-carrier protein] reductase